MRACDCDRGRRRRRWENGCTPFNCQLVSEPCPTRLDTVTRRPGRQSSFLSLSLSLFFNSASSSSSSSSSSFVRRFFFVWVLLRRRMPAASHRVFLHRRRCSTSCFVAASNWPPPLLMWSLLALNQGHSMAFLCFVLFLFFFVVFFSVSSDTDPHFLFDSFARFCFRFCFCFGRRRLSNGSTISSGRVGYRDINFIGWWWWCCCSPGEWRGRERRSSSSSTIG